MPSHARPKPSRIPRTLLRAGLVISAAGSAIAAGGAASAGAAPAPAPARSTDTGKTASALTGALLHSTAGGIGPLKNIQLDPLANTPVDPLANAVSTQVADFKPLSTSLVTGNLSRGAAIRDVPLVKHVAKILPG
ncbi:hypothetical protein [Streptomyces inhibens]|uniref:hypothetical protein n=1 Tax=Streptomyces inhibens TaxID=2293571 RepID=UPI001EE75CFA|nr:hypothetical protein [Streptomyces inhibens]UKY52343.1 hypothetical protein KI385_28425 [Streptomyces inhibens]